MPHARSTCLLWVLAGLMLAASAEDFIACPDGIFVSDERFVQVERQPWSGDYRVVLDDGKEIRFIGPIFPGYQVANAGSLTHEPSGQAFTESQRLDKPAATISKRHALANGGVLTEVSFDAAAAGGEAPV